MVLLSLLPSPFSLDLIPQIPPLLERSIGRQVRLQWRTEMKPSFTAW